MLRLSRHYSFTVSGSSLALVGLAICGALASAAAGVVASAILCGAALALAVARAPEVVARRIAISACLATVAAILLCPAAVLAQAAAPAPAGSTVDVGAWFSDARGAIEAVIGVVVGLILTALSWLVKKNLGISIDAKYRDALQSALMNGVHAGLDHVEAATHGETLDLKSEIAARAVVYVRDFANDAAKHFKLDDNALAEMARAQLAKLLPAEAVANVTGVSAPRAS